MAGQRSRRHVFTLNNPQPGDDATLRAAVEVSQKARYVLFGVETGESGTPHYQGVVIFSQPQTPQRGARVLGLPRAHLEIMRGTFKQAVTYAKKDGDWEEFGEPPRQGRRTDIERVYSSAGKMSIREFVSSGNEVGLQSLKLFQTLEAISIAPWDPCEQRTTRWLHGSTGTGKTKTAFFEALLLARSDYLRSFPAKEHLVTANWEAIRNAAWPAGAQDLEELKSIRRYLLSRIWVSNGSLRWFQGYSGQKYVILDDVRAEDVGFNQLLRLLDRYPMQVEVKGTSVNWVASHIWITSPLTPQALFSGFCGPNDDNIAQLERRLTSITSLD
jgi:hypothetical protein